MGTRETSSTGDDRMFGYRELANRARLRRRHHKATARKARRRTAPTALPATTPVLGLLAVDMGVSLGEPGAVVSAVDR
jgi:hypothetical protein